MAAGDIRGRGLICKHPSKGLKKAAALLVPFKVEGGVSAALEIDALVPSFIFLQFASDGTNHLECARLTKQPLFFLHMMNPSHTK